MLSSRIHAPNETISRNFLRQDGFTVLCGVTALVNTAPIRGHKQLTDIYLLALCQQNQGMTTETIIAPRTDLILRL